MKNLKKQTILVTGGAGFIGSNFIYYFLNPKMTKTLFKSDASPLPLIKRNFSSGILKMVKQKNKPLV